MPILTTNLCGIIFSNNYGSLTAGSVRMFIGLARHQLRYNNHHKISTLTKSTKNVVESGHLELNKKPILPNRIISAPFNPKSQSSYRTLLRCIHSDTRTSSNHSVTRKRRNNTMFDLDAVARWKSPEFTFSYTRKDAILYALGVCADATNRDCLKYVYEGHPDFAVLPSYGCLLAHLPVLQCEAYTGGIPGLPIKLEQVLHGEQWLRLHRELPAEATTKSRIEVAEIMDKSSGAVVLYNVFMELEGGEKLLEAQFNIFIVGSGGFGGKRKSDKIKPLAEIPSSAPEDVISVKTHTNQAALYRLSGDLNPLHIDPDFAAKGGFSSPILHGLCTMGSAITSVITKYSQRRLREFKVRFAKPVYPGNQLKTELWHEKQKILFRTKVEETGEHALTGCYLLFDEHK